METVSAGSPHPMTEMLSVHVITWGPAAMKSQVPHLAELAVDRPSLLRGSWIQGPGRVPYPAEVRLEGLPNLLPLGIVAVRDNVNDGVFVSS